MTKHEHDIINQLLEAVKDSVDFDAASPRLGLAANDVEAVLDEAKAEGFCKCYAPAATEATNKENA